MNFFTASLLPLSLGIFGILAIAPSRGDWKNSISFVLSVLALLGTLAFAILIPDGSYFGGAVSANPFNRMLAGLTTIFLILAIILTRSYLAKAHLQEPEWRLTVLFIAMGCYVLCFAEDLATIFVSFELLSIPSYALVGFSRKDGRSNEASIKYLVLGVLGSLFFLAGIVLLYGASGQIFLSGIRDDLTAAIVAGHTDPVALGEVDLYRLGLGAILIGLLFKVGAAPFHAWLLDIYKGSSFAALSIVGVAAKVAVFGLLFRFLNSGLGPLRGTWVSILALAACASFLVGGFLGIRQNNLKRILACSSIMSAGFLILAIGLDKQLFIFYLAAYGSAALGTVAIYMALGTKAADVDEVADLQGAGVRQPGSAFWLTILLLSSAGIPLTAGFAGKFGIIYNLFQNTETLAQFAGALGAVSSVLSMYFYFRPIRAAWFVQTDSHPVAGKLSTYAIVGALLAIALLVLGVQPSLLYAH